MLFDTTVRAELARSFGATLVVILTIVLTSFLIRTIGQAASGVVSPQDVVLLLGFTALGHLPTMLALSLFIAVVLSLGRMYRDSEMVIWFSSGAGLARFVRPVLRTCWPVLLVVGLLLLFVWPWGNAQTQELRQRYQQRSDISRIAPGVFQTSSDGRRTFFVERDGSDALNARNVFILSRETHGESVTSAKSGRVVTEGDDRFLVLEQGQRNQIDTKSADKTLSRFESYRVLTEERALSAAQVRPPKATPTIDLVRSGTPEAQGELVWRMGLLFAAGNLVLLGIGLSSANPRRPSNWNLLFAVLAFFIYFNLVNLSQVWVASARVAPATAVMALHGSVFLLALALLWWREHANVLRVLRMGKARP
jgi:lipopolysaccharide export system permease protein